MFDDGLLGRLIARALQHGGEYADVFCERRRAHSYRLQDGRIHDASYAVTLGVGVRVVDGESAGYASSDDLCPEALMRAADAASLVARTSTGGNAAAELRAEPVGALYESDAADAPDPQRYVALLERSDATARRYDPKV